MSIHNNASTKALLNKLIERTSKLVKSQNLVAFSGGVDSSLVAWLVHEVVVSNNNNMEAKAVIGVSPSLPKHQQDVAKSIAQHIGIPLVEIETDEGLHQEYIKNQGDACYVCKTSLYSVLKNIVEYSNTQQQLLLSNSHHDLRLFNGTNADDKTDPTRVGLIAAANFDVKSPLEFISKADVRNVAKYIKLPNWNAAAAPCLRSRLSFGVEATAQHLAMIEDAENLVRKRLREEVLAFRDELDPSINIRVRMIAGSKAVIELDSQLFVDYENIDNRLLNAGIREDIEKLGFVLLSQIRPFKSGSVAITRTVAKEIVATV